MKGSLITIAIIFVLSLSIFVFFDIYSTRLNEEETVVVVGLCIIVVLSVKWLWNRVSKKVAKNGQ